jgi:hypothetical protein
LKYTKSMLVTPRRLDVLGSFPRVCAPSVNIL